ncbi:MoaD/ThiS [Backusella circina FSU 941]|nr:MoaD/ThiS [Backusella circina FSU 941]
MTKIKVLYFASVKDVTGIEQEQIELEKDSATLVDLGTLLTTRYGNDKIKVLLEQSLYAIDMDYINKEDEKSTILKDGMEIAIIPPVSGG